jgi:hypothetical protein
MPATALAAMSTSIEGANPQLIVPVPIGIGLDIVITELDKKEINEPNSVNARSIAPRRPRISESRPTYQEFVLARIYAGG